MTLFSDAVEKLRLLYGMPSEEVESKLLEIGDRFNFKKQGSNDVDHEAVIWKNIEVALLNRKSEAREAIAAIESVLTNPRIADKLTLKMQELKSLFIADFASHKIDGASYHFYGHGEEMSKDPGDFIPTLLPDRVINPLIQATVNALGAAHDIIQGQTPFPKNERLSADLFNKRTKEMINILITELSAEATGLSADELKILEDYREKAVKFLSEECIVNSTYLLFNSGKRDFDNILLLIQKSLVHDAKSDLDPVTAAMKMSMTISDTRRSEIKHVLKKFEVIDNIPEEQFTELEKLLQGIALLKPGETIKNLKAENRPGSESEEKLMKIEGFLLRIGQNIRMSAELSVVMKREEAEKIPGRERVTLISDIRANKDVSVNTEAHLQPFLGAILGPFGECAFARALGEIDQRELKEQAEFYGITLNDHNFDFSGWMEHAGYLEETKKFLETADTKPFIAEILFTIASKSPGHRVSKETYAAMKNMVVKSGYMLVDDNLSEGQLNANLLHEIAEIEGANPYLCIGDISHSGDASGRTIRSSTPVSVYSAAEYVSDSELAVQFPGCSDDHATRFKERSKLSLFPPKGDERSESNVQPPVSPKK